MTTKTFHLGDILSVTTSALLSPRGIDGLTDLLDWMTGERPLRHQIKRFAAECRGPILAQHPDLSGITVPGGLRDDEAGRSWFAEVIAEYGETREVSRLPGSDHTHIDPVTELLKVVPRAGIILVAGPDAEPPVDAEQRSRIVRDLDNAAREAARSAARMDRLFRQLMESDERAMSAGDVITVGNALQAVVREVPELRRVFAKQARLIAGPPPRLAIRSTGEPERLGIIARCPSGNLDVGDAARTGTGDDTGWRVRLTDLDGSVRATIGLCYGGAVDDLLEAVTRHMDEYGPWWAPEEAPGDR